MLGGALGVTEGDLDGNVSGISDREWLGASLGDAL